MNVLLNIVYLLYIRVELIVQVVGHKVNSLKTALDLAQIHFDVQLKNSNLKIYLTIIYA